MRKILNTNLVPDLCLNGGSGGGDVGSVSGMAGGMTLLVAKSVEMCA